MDQDAGAARAVSSACAVFISSSTIICMYTLHSSALDLCPHSDRYKPPYLLRKTSNALYASRHVRHESSHRPLVSAAKPDETHVGLHPLSVGSRLQDPLTGVHSFRL